MNRLHGSMKTKLLLRYQVTFDYERFKLDGVNGVSIAGLHYKDERRRLSFSAEELKIRVNIRHLLSYGKISTLTISNAALKVENDRGSEVANNKTNYNARLMSMYKAAFRKIRQLHQYLPQTLQLNNVIVVAGQSGNKRVHINTCLLENNSCVLMMSVLNGGKTHQLELHGNTCIKKERASMSMEFSIDTKYIVNTSHTLFKAVDEELQLKLDIRWAKTETYHCSFGLKTNTLLLENIPGLEAGARSLQLDIACKMDRTGFFVQDTAAIHFGHLSLSGFLKHLFSDRGSLEIGVRLIPCSMQELLSSLPAFQYKDLYSATYDGKLGISAVLKMMLQAPFTFEWQMIPDNNITIINPGRLDLNFLKTPFVHNTVDTDFVPLENIPIHLRNAIVISEDRNFYRHRGIDLPAIGLAIMVNLATRRFSRGASTLSMQLIRNLFLSNARTVHRKIEELLLTWLMEEVFIVSKDRILELYLNIIEFGPGMYGITAAAEYYFGKSPEHLSLTECLVLSYIVPRPKFFIEAVKQGSFILYENLAKHIDSISEDMLESGLLTMEEKNSREQVVIFANGLGSISLLDPMRKLHPVLRKVFIKALEVWDLQYKDLPRPSISRTECSPGPVEEIFAFYISFRDRFGINRSTASLFTKFAELMSAADTKGEVSWGKSVADEHDMTCFRLKYTHLNIVDKVIANGSLSDL